MQIINDNQIQITEIAFIETVAIIYINKCNIIIPLDTSITQPF